MNKHEAIKLAARQLKRELSSMPEGDYGEPEFIWDLEGVDSDYAVIVLFRNRTEAENEND